MGGCCASREPRISYACSFPLCIEKTFTIERIREGAELNIQLSSPTQSTGEKCELDAGVFAKISACAVAGYNARLQVPTECKDRVAFHADNDAVFAVVVDGHGEFGSAAADSTSNSFLTYFRSHRTEFYRDPESSLREAFRSCQEELHEAMRDLRGETGPIEDWMYSGATCAIVFLYNSVIYTASVGDPRVLLTTTLSRIRKRRAKASVSAPAVQCPLPANLEVAQLTLDQFISSSHEADRFTDPATVRCCKDAFGSDVGPLRLWLPLQQFPGLKVARTLGDFGLDDFGIKHTPIIQTIDLQTQKDLSIILATDGVWSVMDNQEISAFVHKFAPSCLRLNDAEEEIEEKQKVTTKTATIARLLCEESRRRWFDVIRHCDVESDDAACVVIEIHSKERHRPEPEDSLLSESKRKIATAKTVNVPHAAAVACPRHFDARRRSMISRKQREDLAKTNSILSSSMSFRSLVDRSTESTTSSRRVVKRHLASASLVLRARSSASSSQRNAFSTLSVSARRHQVSILPPS